MAPEIERLAIQYAAALVEYYDADRSLANLGNPQYKQIFHVDRIKAKERLDAAETELHAACQAFSEEKK
jgi:hypothetical protein